jgi:hypothetical protein
MIIIYVIIIVIYDIIAGALKFLSYAEPHCIITFLKTYTYLEERYCYLGILFLVCQL